MDGVVTDMALDRPEGGSDAPVGAIDLAPDTADSGDGPVASDAPDGAADGPSIPPPCPPGQYRNVVRASCVRAHDLNRDGKADLLAVNQLDHHALLSDGVRFTFAPWLAGGFYGVGGALAADVTGDGFADGVGFGYGYVGVVTTGHAGFGNTRDHYFNWTETPLLGSKATFLADADGDGRADAVAVFDNEISVALSDGVRFVTPPTHWGSGDFTNMVALFAADVDGDGMSDVIGTRSQTIAVWLSTGSNFLSEATWRSSSFTGSDATFFADVDGDGRADGVGIDRNVARVARSTGATFDEDQRWFDSTLLGSDATFVADADGDGQADVIAVNSSSVSVALSTGTAFAPPTTWYAGQFRGDFNTTTAPPPSTSFARARRAAVGLFRPGGEWLLRTAPGPGAPDIEVQFGQAGDVPVVGDWDGDGVTTIGVVRREGGNLRWLLRNSLSAGQADLDLLFGSETDEPVTGDWDGDGTTTIGVVRPDATWDELHWLLRNSNMPGSPDLAIAYGSVSLNDAPVAGDWDGNGTTTIGVFRVGAARWLLRNSNSAGESDIEVEWGDPLDLPVVGDWVGNGVTTIGIFRPAGTPLNPTSLSRWLLRDHNSDAWPDIDFFFGAAGGVPVAGKWSSLP